MSGDIDNNTWSLSASSDIMSISSVSDPIFNQFNNKFIYMYVSEWSVFCYRTFTYFMMSSAILICCVSLKHGSVNKLRIKI
jgi:hypothetical protein